MRIKYFLILAIVFLFSLTAVAQEGHPAWWWDTKSADFIVEGEITYDSTKYFELNPVNVGEKDRKYYWIVGKIKIGKILFINKYSQHLESYQQYLKHTEKDYPVLIPAMQRTVFPSHASGSIVLQPILGLDIPREPTVFNLSQIYIFPILDLKLESVVPRENIKEAVDLIEKRPNDYLADVTKPE